MASRIPLPAHLTSGPFAVSAGSAAGLSVKRMRGSDLHRPFRGIRTTHDAPEDIVEVCRARALRLRDDQFLSHSTAALVWGVPLPLRITADSARRPHASVVRPALPPDARDIVGHSTASLLRAPVMHLGLRIASPLDTWAQLASQVALPDLIAAGDYLVSGGHPLLTIADLEYAASAFAGRPGRAAMTKAVALVRRGPLSRPETHARLVLRTAGLPEPEVNAIVLDRRGRFLAMGDLVWRRERLLAEYEGDYHRTDVAQFRKDISRRERVEDNGWRLTRFTRENLCSRPREFLERMSQRLGAPITKARMARAIALASSLEP